MRRKVAWVVAALLCFGVLSAFAAMAGAAPPEAKPSPPPAHKEATVDWNPSVISRTELLAPGESFTTTIFFSVTQSLADVNVEVMPPSAADSVVVEPSHFDNVAADQSYSIIVTVTAPAGYGPRQAARIWLREQQHWLSPYLPVKWQTTPPPQAHISWSPSRITSTQSLQPGESFSETASLTTTLPVTHVDVAVVRSLRGAQVSVSPSHFDSLEPAVQYGVVITVTASAGSGPQGGIARIALRHENNSLPGALLLSWKPPPAPSPTISWTPAAISETVALSAGESMTVTASFTATGAMANATVVVKQGNNGGGRVAVTPQQFASIVPGETYSVSVVITAGTKPDGVSAIVALRNGSHAVANPLPVAWHPPAAGAPGGVKPANASIIKPARGAASRR